MHFMISADTDVGRVKPVNQDSVMVQVLATELGQMALAVLCDGVGGLSKGELASAEVIRAFGQWAKTRLPLLCRQIARESPALWERPAALLLKERMLERAVRQDWEALVAEQNRRLALWGARNEMHLGTTVVAMLVTETRYYLLNVGDSRAYQIRESAEQITRDHSLIANQVQEGRLAVQEAQADEWKHMLLQCVGASAQVRPDWFCGKVRPATIYLLCSDGFWQRTSEQEIGAFLRPDQRTDEQLLRDGIRSVIEMNKKRMEPDNITAAVIRVF